MMPIATTYSAIRECKYAHQQWYSVAEGHALPLMAYLHLAVLAMYA
jgi:hypothetical protein